MSIASLLVLSDDVKAALVALKPVVALESTLISHGLPWPQNKRVGQEIEACLARCVSVLGKRALRAQ